MAMWICDDDQITIRMMIGDAEMNEFFPADETPVPNVARLRKVVEWVEEQEQLPMWQRDWSQGDWVYARDRDWLSKWLPTDEARKLDVNVCKTVRCCAGEIAFEDGFDLDWDGTCNEYIPNEDDSEEHIKKMREFEHKHCALYAAKALGLDDQQADQLFSGSNSAAQIRRLAEQFTGEPL